MTAKPIQIAALILSVFFVGCGGCKSAGKQQPSAQQQLSAIQQAVAHNTAAISQHVAAARTAKTVQSITPHLEAIDVANNSNADELKQFENAIVAEKQIETDRDAAVARATKAEASATSELRHSLVWLIVASIIATAAGGALVFSGNKIGIGIAVAGAIGVAVSLFVTSLAPILPWVVGAIGLLGVVYVAYQLWLHRKAVSELTNNTSSQPLSASTKNLVSAVRDRIRFPPFVAQHV